MAIGPYEVLGEIGRGGMGVVVRARSPGGTVVAIKQLLQARKPDAVARFERERRLLSELGEKDGFVPLLDAGVTPHGPYIVMPFLSKGTLRARLKRGALPVDEVISIGRALARAMARAHERKIVHRDLKPDNVLFSDDGRPLVTDLGLAKHFARDNPDARGSVSISLDGEIVGSVGYMAPEQMNDAKHVGPPTDVFALGSMLYECLTGEKAFDADSAHAVLAKVALGEHDSPRKHRPDAPRWLCDVIDRAIAVKVEDRYPDASALAAALAGGERASTRGALVAASALVVLAALGIGIVLASSSGEEPSPARNAANASRNAIDERKKPEPPVEPRVVARIPLPEDMYWPVIRVDSEVGRIAIGGHSEHTQTLVFDAATNLLVQTLGIGACSLDPTRHLFFGVTCSGREAVSFDAATLA
ncbi:serine/threonine protein kinase, partial [bacterium]|nr:serine/threonine protein kinase [bacterium]